MVGSRYGAQLRNKLSGTAGKVGRLGVGLQSFTEVSNKALGMTRMMKLFMSVYKKELRYQRR